VTPCLVVISAREVVVKGARVCVAAVHNLLYLVVCEDCCVDVEVC
jgi:hypothetical protein